MISRVPVMNLVVTVTFGIAPDEQDDRASIWLHRRNLANLGELVGQAGLNGVDSFGGCESHSRRWLGSGRRVRGIGRQ
jgi:hypothetical protein